MTLKLENVLLYRYDDTLLSIDACVNDGDVLSLMGPSGSGKSTLLNAISGQLTAPFRMQGRIYINAQCINDVPAYKRNVGVLYQDALLFEHMTVGQNIAFALPADNRRSSKETNMRVGEMLAQIGLEDLQHRPVQTLSGGQQARIALLRTLAAKPSVVLLDEPFSKLDASTKAQMRTWVFEQLKSRKLPTVLVTHDREDANAAGGNIVEIPVC